MPQQHLIETVNDYLDIFSRALTIPRPERRELLKYLLDGYASANFAYEGEDEQVRTLEEADLMKVFADVLSNDLEGIAFDHYSLEEIYSYPVEKNETVQARVIGLLNRSRDYAKVDHNRAASSALHYAKQIQCFYKISTKLKTFWQGVIVHLEEIVEAKKR